MTRRLAAALVFGVGAMCCGALANTAHADASWRCDALELGRNRYPARLINGAPEGARRVELPWLFYLLRHGERVMLIDTGIASPEVARRLHLRGYQGQVQLLGALGLQPAQVTDVILTHSHFDHAGGLALFSRARIWISEAERRAIARGAPKRARLRQLDALLRRATAAGRLELVSPGGRRGVLPGVDLEVVGGHTAGSMVVWLQRAKKRCLFAGDECYLRRACLTAEPLPSASRYSRARNVAFLQRVARRAKAGALEIYSGHDAGIARGGRDSGRPGITSICNP